MTVLALVVGVAVVVVVVALLWSRPDLGVAQKVGWLIVILGLALGLWPLGDSGQWRVGVPLGAVLYLVVHLVHVRRTGRPDRSRSAGWAGEVRRA